MFQPDAWTVNKVLSRSPTYRHHCLPLACQFGSKLQKGPIIISLSGHLLLIHVQFSPWVSSCRSSWTYEDCIAYNLQLLCLVGSPDVSCPNYNLCLGSSPGPQCFAWVPLLQHCWKLSLAPTLDSSYSICKLSRNQSCPCSARTRACI